MTNLDFSQYVYERLFFLAQELPLNDFKPRAEELIFAFFQNRSIDKVAEPKTY